MLLTGLWSGWPCPLLFPGVRAVLFPNCSQVFGWHTRIKRPRKALSYRASNEARLGAALSSPYWLGAPSRRKGGCCWQMPFGRLSASRCSTGVRRGRQSGSDATILLRLPSGCAGNSADFCRPLTAHVNTVVAKAAAVDVFERAQFAHARRRSHHGASRELLPTLSESRRQTLLAQVRTWGDAGRHTYRLLVGSV